MSFVIPIVVYCAVLLALAAAYTWIISDKKSPALEKLIVCAALLLAMLLWVITSGDVGQIRAVVSRFPARLQDRGILPESFAETARRAREEARECRAKAEDLERRLDDLDRRIERDLLDGAGGRAAALKAERGETARRFRDARRDWALAAQRARCAAEAAERGDRLVAPRIVLDPEKEWKERGSER